MARIRVALITSGFETGGGVPTTARWLRDGLEATGNYSVDVHDLATSASDPLSRRILRSNSWFRRSLTDSPDSEGGVKRWGANAVEVEPMRYRPRSELTRTLAKYDLVQVVAGGAALAGAATKVNVPVILLVATKVSWERASQRSVDGALLRFWRLWMTAMTSRVEIRSLTGVDAVLVMNDAMLALVRSLGQLKVMKAPPGVDTVRFAPNRSGWRSDGHLLSVCRLADPRKGLGRLVRAYGEMVQTNELTPHLILAGKGQLPSPASDLIQSLGLDSRIDVRPNVGPEELVDLYQGASIYLQASYEEGHGLSVLEAMACGLPVVATDTAGTRESLVDGETGWLIEQLESEHVAKLIATRAQQVLDGGGSEMSVRARERSLAQFSDCVSLKRYIDTYESLLK